MRERKPIAKIHIEKVKDGKDKITIESTAKDMMILMSLGII